MSTMSTMTFFSLLNTTFLNVTLGRRRRTPVHKFSLGPVSTG
jgi:hypothetical protein